MGVYKNREGNIVPKLTKAILKGLGREVGDNDVVVNLIEGPMIVINKEFIHEL